MLRWIDQCYVGLINVKLDGSMLCWTDQCYVGLINVTFD